MESKTVKTDIALKEVEISKHKSEIATNGVKSELDKIELLNNLLQSMTIDDENTLLSSEPKWKRVYDDIDQEMIKNKIFELIKKL